MSNNKNTILYIGVTSNLVRRTIQHKTGYFPGFTKKYNVKKLVYFEDGSVRGDDGSVRGDDGSHSGLIAFLTRPFG